MATATRLRTEESSAWSKTFPTEQATVQQSLLFVKKLLAVAVSSITYIRGIFDENAFADRCLEELKLKILREDSSSPGACQVIQWVKGCFDALEKRYIYVNPEDPETVIESYTFKFSYQENGGVNIFRNEKKIFSARMAEETKRATRSMLRTIILLTNSLRPLPDDVMMSMKLLYYDEVTPTDYEPPGFTPSISDNFQFEDETMNIDVGSVATLRVKTDSKQFTEGGMEPGEPEEPLPDAAAVGEPMMEAGQSAQHNGARPPQEAEIISIGLDREEDLSTGLPVEQEDYGLQSGHSSLASGGDAQVVPTEGPREAASVTGGSAAVPGSGGQAVSTTGSHMQEVASNSDENVVCCACGVNEDDGLMILCDKCQCWQHGVCYKVLDDGDTVPAVHICDRCAEQHGLVPTDDQLSGLTDIAKQATCLWRRALVTCGRLSRVLPHSLAQSLGVDLAVANGLMRRLEKEGFISTNNKGKRLGKPLNKEKLKEGMKKYFKHKGSTTGHVKEEDRLEVTADEKKQNEVEFEIAKLAAKADDLNLSGQRRPGRSCTKSSQSQMSVHKERGKKRVKVVDSQGDFVLSNSQDPIPDPDGQHRKRRKASNSRKPLRV